MFGKGGKHIKTDTLELMFGKGGLDRHKALLPGKGTRWTLDLMTGKEG